MKKNLLLLSSLLLSLAAPLSSVPPIASFYQNDFSFSSFKSPEEEKAFFDALLKEFEETLLSFSPENATFKGKKIGLTEWSSSSYETSLKQKNWLLDFASRLKLVEGRDFSSADTLNLYLLQREITSALESSQFASRYFLLSPMFGIHQMIPSVLQKMPNTTLEDKETILIRLKKVPLLLEETKSTLLEGIKEGVTLPKVALNALPLQIRGYLQDTPDRSAFFAPFYSLNDAIEEERLLKEEALDYITHSIFPAYENLALFVDETYIPQALKSGFKHLPQGKKWYAFIVKTETTTDLTPKEIHLLGMQEILRIEQEMKKILENLHFEGSLEDFFEFVKGDSFSFKSEKELLASYENLSKTLEKKLPLLFAEIPKTPLVIKEVPSAIAEGLPLAYYQPGNYEHHIPGTFYVNTSSINERFIWQVPTIFLHEAIPGHHYQLSINNEDASLPSFRNFFFYTAFIEGWALYCESLGKEFGLYEENSYDHFGYLYHEMLRAVRLVVDTGLHSFDWSQEEAIDFFIKKTGAPKKEAVTEVNRYLVMPGQALSYKIGQLKILELRKRAEALLQEKFDLKKFHQALLKEGPLPLDILEEQIDNWIELEKKSVG